jgi:phage terminase large subunit
MPFGRKPDYSAVYERRRVLLARMQEGGPPAVEALREHYRQHPEQMISDWCQTTDPRSVARGKAASVPFVLWPRQVELVQWLTERWRKGEPGTIVKSRDVGASYVSMAWLVVMAVLEPGFAGGVTSATEAKLDRSGDPDTLFAKLKEVLRSLPEQLRAGFIEEKHAFYLRLVFPDTGASITGEVGPNAGRGGRKSAFIVDEAAFIPDLAAVDAALSANSDCVIHLSSVNGMAHPFYLRATNPHIPRIDVTWRHDPRKGMVWYAKKLATEPRQQVAAEVDCDFAASTAGQLIRAEWLHSCIDAAARLGVDVSGARSAALDISDQGGDRNSLCVRHGIEVTHLESWSGQGSTIYQTMVKTFFRLDAVGVNSLTFDGDGLGAGARGDGEVLNDERRREERPEIELAAFRGSGAVIDPEGSMIAGRANRDYFQNAKAMGWMALAQRIENTHKALTGLPYDANNLLSIPGGLPERTQLFAELLQIQYTISNNGKFTIVKTPPGMRSPNLADSLMMCFAPKAGSYLALPSRAGEAVTAEVEDENPRVQIVAAVLAMTADAVACVFVGVNAEGHQGPLRILDYDLSESMPDGWFRGIQLRLVELYQQYGAIALPAPYVDAGLFEQYLTQIGVPHIELRAYDKLPLIPERFAAARFYTSSGRVRIEPAARSRVVSYHGQTRNYLTELVGATQAAEGNALAVALVTAVLLAFQGRMRLPKPTEVAVEEVDA